MSIFRNKMEDSLNGSRKRRGSSRYYLFFLICLVALGALGTGMYLLLLNVSWFDLREVQLQGNVSVADSLIHNITRPYLGQNLLRISKRGISGEVLEFARIKNVKIRRRLLHTLSIQILERKGLIYLKSTSGDLFPIDEEAVVLERYGSVYTEDLPILSTYLDNSGLKAGTQLDKPYIKSALQLHKRIQKEAADFLPLVSEYYVIDSLVYIVDARYGTRIIPSTQNLAKQFKRYQFVQDNGNINRNSVVDLRFDNQVVVKAGN